MIKVLGHEGLVRDPSTNAILNVDVEGRNNYLKRKKKQKELEERLNTIERNYSELNEKLNRILGILEK